MAAGARVLIVEDQPLLALDLQNLLEAYGYEVAAWASDLPEAERIIAQGQIDVALVDFLLNEQPADALAKQLAAKNIPFAFCTGSDEKDIASRYPSVPILSKPYMAEDVILQVQSLLS